MDFRLNKIIFSWLTEKGILQDTDFVSVAGACKDLVIYPFSSESRYLMSMIDLAITKHGVKTIILTQHQDCAGYGGQGCFATVKDEKAHLIADLKKVKGHILQKHAQLDIKMFLICQKDKNWNFEEIKD
ncbi:MAG: hypothetical protein A2Y67_02705 [Candidatus Buchananbacteria bacterium RBG_13_39_9]|uniref:Carbonic anhydrase n=1 Tax=Candidatus Buchananbacteria bacterium RBG_13_39_9 TaxID=1797531 RepID=A0A1G1XMQ0_9BACT|nr:MAG: hypothetical protein A2Y67_02705 [Candidatus Buchananbacteria bacterium RBG_13_39_9]